MVEAQLVPSLHPQFDSFIGYNIMFFQWHIGFHSAYERISFIFTMIRIKLHLLFSFRIELQDFLIGNQDNLNKIQVLDKHHSRGTMLKGHIF